MVSLSPNPLPLTPLPGTLLKKKEGWKGGIDHAMTDGILTQTEEASLREFRDRLALADSGSDQKATAQLEKASTDRLMLDASLVAVAFAGTFSGAPALFYKT